MKKRSLSIALAALMAASALAACGSSQSDSAGSSAAKTDESAGESKADGKERAHHCRRGLAVGSSSLAAVLDPVNLSIATTSAPSHHALGTLCQPRFGAASIMSSNLAGPVPARTASSAATRTGHEPAAG